jgi:hypothetical protein
LALHLGDRLRQSIGRLEDRFDAESTSHGLPLWFGARFRVLSELSAKAFVGEPDLDQGDDLAACSFGCPTTGT